MLLTILVAIAVASLIAYLSLRKKETKQEPEIKHVIAEIEPVEFEESTTPEFNIVQPIVEEKKKSAKKSTTKKTSAKKSTKNGK